MNNNPRQNNDVLKESTTDEKKVQSDQAQMDMPEVKGIPGQEHIKPPEMGEFLDTTISSDDEEEFYAVDDDEMGVGD